MPGSGRNTPDLSHALPVPLCRGKRHGTLEHPLLLLRLASCRLPARTRNLVERAAPRGSPDGSGSLPAPDLPEESLSRSHPDLLAEPPHRRLFDSARWTHHSVGHSCARTLRSQLARGPRLPPAMRPVVGVRPRFLWPTSGEVGRAWHVRIDKLTQKADFDLLVPMEGRSGPMNFFVAASSDVLIQFSRWLTEQFPRGHAVLVSLTATTSPTDQDRSRAISG